MYHPPLHMIAACFALLLGTTPAIDGLETAYDILQEYDFPIGILPTGVKSYEINKDTGKFAAYFDGSCSFTIKGYTLKYTNKITGTIFKGRLSNLGGVQVKIMLFWLNIVQVTHDGEDLNFSVGITSASFSVDNFYVCPQCGCGFSCLSRDSNLHSLVYSS